MTDWMSGAAVSGACNCIDWFREKFMGGRMSFAELDLGEELPGRMPVFLPFLFGERNPGWNDGRMGGFVDRAAEAYPGIEVVATQPGDWVRETGMNAAMDMLQAHPEINVIYGLSDEMALGAVQACKQIGRDDIIVVGLDGNPNALESVKAGELDATLDCGPVAIGANAVLAIIDAINGVEREEKVIEAETTVVDITLVDQFLPAE